MKTAKEYAKLATQIGQTADLLQPADSDPYAQTRRLAVFHLRNAARLAREIAEHQAQREEPAP